MKNKIVIAILIMMILFITGCDPLKEVVSIEVNDYPNRITYYAGNDQKLDLTGGKVWLKNKNGDAWSQDMKTMNISENINFNSPGVYKVRIKYSDEISCTFAVEVIDSNKISK